MRIYTCKTEELVLSSKVQQYELEITPLDGPYTTFKTKDFPRGHQYDSLHR